MKKRKLKKEAKLLIILMVLILVAVILLIAINSLILNNPNNSQDKNFVNDATENIASKNGEDNTIKVVIDNKDKENNTANENTTNTAQNNNQTNEANVTNNNIVNEGTVTTTKDKNTYYIKINNQANVVTVYTKDSKGKYTVPVKAMLCSIGEATPKSGVYKTSDMYKWRLLQGDVYGQYAVRITGHILFHSVPYTKQSKDTLEWWEYDKLGTDASLGCIRLTVEDAKWIYDNCPKGTKVEFYASADPGPLGKPTAKKISSYAEGLKIWDPTDPDNKNPWKTYVEASNPSEEDTVQTGTTPTEPTKTNNTNTTTDNIKINHINLK